MPECHNLWQGMNGKMAFFVNFEGALAPSNSQRGKISFGVSNGLKPL
ncbi:hypothetical protein THER_0348 [Thermodesulfovibrio sp. N1]|nr:hypothetical protein THER_0348 [Thermodesulfovibrio sp. N1]